MRKETEWIIKAVEEAAKTADRNGEYWRATYTEQDRKVTELLTEYMREGGMEVYSDAIGNLFGRVQGKSEQTVMSGSHRDTVRCGGKYDGMLGVLTAIKAISSLYEELGQPEKTIEAAAFCEEESSRFLGSSYPGSSHLCGVLSREDLKAADENGITMEEAAKEAGYLQEPLSCGRCNLEHFVELHIEQGGLLENREKQVGIVTSIVGLFTGEVIFRGRQNHAGTTPMYLRNDPVQAAAAYIDSLFRWAQQYMEDMVCTVGSIRTVPGNSNVIASEVIISFDIRSAKKERIEEAGEILHRLAEEMQRGIEAEVRISCNEPPVQLDVAGIGRLKTLAEDRQLSYEVMTSGAGHDSQVIAQQYPVNMIFVPSVSGISHNPEEFTEPADIEAGYLLLRDYIKELAW